MKGQTISMKKTLQTLLVLTMVVVLVFSGCGKQDTSDTTATTLADAGKETTAPAVSTEAPTEASTEAPTAAPTEAPTEAGDEVRSASLSTFENGVYENTYVGFGCKLDENWQVATAEQLQDLPDAIGDILKDTEIGDAVSSTSQIFDVQGQNLETSVSFNLVYTELNAPQRLSYMMMSDENIVDANILNKETLIEAYSQMGLTVDSIEKQTATFLGEDRVGMLTTASANGQTVYMMQFFDYGLGGKYGVTTTFTGLSLDSVQELMNQFYAIG